MGSSPATHGRAWSATRWRPLKPLHSLSFLSVRVQSDANDPRDQGHPPAAACEVAEKRHDREGADRARRRGHLLPEDPPSARVCRGRRARRTGDERNRRGGENRAPCRACANGDDRCADRPAPLQAIGTRSHAAARAGVAPDVDIEIDVGAHRCGVLARSPALALANAITRAPGLRLRGLQAYQGAAQHLREPAARRAAIAVAATEARRTRELIIGSGIACACRHRGRDGRGNTNAIPASTTS